MTLADGIITFTGIQKFASGTAGAPSIAFSADADVGLYYASTLVGVTIGGTGQVTFTDGAILPVTDNDIDLGSSSYEFKNLYIDGTATIDTIDGATIDGGTY